MLPVLAALAVFAALAAVLFAMPAVHGWGVYRRFRDKRTVVCPETQAGATVQGDALGAAATAMYGDPRLRLVACSRWPQRRGCGQECVVQIYDEPVAERGGFHILPVVIGAMATWALLGAIGYSPLFRGLLVKLGVPGQVVRQGYELVLPALLPLIIAIGIGFVIQFALLQRPRSVVGGGAVGAVIGLALAAIALPFVHGGSTLLWVYVAAFVAASALMGIFFTAWSSVAARY